MRIRSGLARSVHLSHTTVRVAAGLSLVAGISAGTITLVQGEALRTAVEHGVLAGGAGFIAWAITREIAPDHPMTAGAAGAIAPFLLIAGPPDLLAAGLVILVARIIAGTTGRDLTPIDLAAVGIGAALVSFRQWGVAVAVALALAPAVSSVWARGSRSLMIVASGATLAAVSVVALFAGHDPWSQPDGLARGLFVAGLAAGLVCVWVVPPVTSTVDSRRGGVVLTHRVRLARVAALVTGVSTALWAGGDGVLALGPAWTALAVTAVSSVATLGEAGISRRPVPPTL